MSSLTDYITKRYEPISGEAQPVKLKMDRNSLPKLFSKFGYKVGAEIGVSKGRYSREICRRTRELKLYCVDPWESYADYVERKGEGGKRALLRHYEEAKKRLEPYNCAFLKMTSMEAVKQFKDGSLDFVYIDGNHTFEYVINDIAEWSKKVRKGGIISGHDYWNSAEGFGNNHLNLDLFIKNLTPQEKIKICQVKDAVDMWTYTNKIKMWFVTTIDDMGTWFWVNE